MRPRRIPERGDVSAGLVAELLGLSLADFEARRPLLQERGFPQPDPTTGVHCIEAVDRWRLRRHLHLFPELTTAPAAAHAGAVFEDIGCGGFMGKVKIPYYTVIAGRGYWRPTPKMRLLGFAIVRCGPDGPDAWALAAEWNKRWQAGTEAGERLRLVNLGTNCHGTRGRPRGAIRQVHSRRGVSRFHIRTPEWAARAYLTREKIWWPAWFRIREMWGDVAPDTITFEMMSKWRAALDKKHGRGVAHKTLRVWRTFWKIMLGMKVARTADPSLGIRNRAPTPRWQRWSEGETVRLVKAAWRHGYKGLACIIAVAWDTQFSPVDVRTLAARHRVTLGGAWCLIGKSMVVAKERCRGGDRHCFAADGEIGRSLPSDASDRVAPRGHPIPDEDRRRLRARTFGTRLRSSPLPRLSR